VVKRLARHPARSAVPILLVVGMVSVLTACGLPRSSTPVTVPKDEVPYGLLGSPTSAATATSTPGVPSVTATIYLADAQQRLVPVEVEVPAAPVEPLVQALLERLAVGPTETERASGLVTFLGPGSTIVLRNLAAGTATIELQSSSQDPSPIKQPAAVGQVVLTACSIVGVDRVVFIRDKTVVQVPGPTEGNLTSDVLSAGSYASLLAPGQPEVPRTVPLSEPFPSTTSTASLPLPGNGAPITTGTATTPTSG
jgi:hypothetical protein